MGGKLAHNKTAEERAVNKRAAWEWPAETGFLFARVISKRTDVLEEILLTRFGINPVQVQLMKLRNNSDPCVVKKLSGWN